MNRASLVDDNLVSALAHGVRQCVVIGARLPVAETLNSIAEEAVQMFAVAEEEPTNAPVTFVPTRFESEGLATALERAHFDRWKTTLLVWLGGAGYRSADAAMASLAYIASLPKGSAVVLDYTVHRSGLTSLTQSALDALASCVSTAGDGLAYLIQPQAVETMLRGLGFQGIVDVEAGGGRHLVSAVV